MRKTVGLVLKKFLGERLDGLQFAGIRLCVERKQERARIGFLVLKGGVVRPETEHIGKNRVNLFRVAADLREAQPALLRDPQIRRFRGRFFGSTWPPSARFPCRMTDLWPS